MDDTQPCPTISPAHHGVFCPALAQPWPVDMSGELAYSYPNNISNIMAYGQLFVWFCMVNLPSTYNNNTHETPAKTG